MTWISNISDYIVFCEFPRREPLLNWNSFITERGMAMLQRQPDNIFRPLRLPDDAYRSTNRIRQSLPSHVLQGFPVAHLRIFSLAKEEHLQCWRGKCANDCTIWNVDIAQTIQKELVKEYHRAITEWENRGSSHIKADPIQFANLIFTVGWFKE